MPNDLPKTHAEVRRVYEDAVARVEGDLARATGSFERIGVMRVVVGLGMLATLGAIAWTTLGSAGWLIELVGLVAFVALVMNHARIVERQRRLEAARSLYRRGLARIAADWGAACRWVDTKAASAEHPYAFDLDIVGERSLISMLDETITPWGRRELGSYLLGDAPSAVADIAARQVAVRDLAARPKFREAWFAEGGALELSEARIAAFVQWSGENDALVPSPVVRILAKVIPVATIGLFVASRFGVIDSWFAAIPLALGVVVSASAARVLTPIIAGAIALGGCRDLLRLLESQSFEAPLLIEHARALSPGHTKASAHLDSLARITGFLEASQQGIFRLFIAPIFMWNLNGAIALDHWRERTKKAASGSSLAAWPRALGAIDGLSCLGTFAYEQPEFPMPEFADTPVFTAKGLGHPMLGSGARVTNDVTLSEAGRALLLTGSNMSGKSTLLRAVGVNAVLAFAGAPVCAISLRIGTMKLGTSMRVQDSLTDGYSHFYAELRRLKEVVDLAGEGPLLFLLDEILHGTNARERILGAKAVVKSLLARRAMGLVSTHDTQIGALEEESAGHVKNVHFMETVEGDAMKFDYRLREGVVQSGNALRLMRALGLEVPVE